MQVAVAQLSSGGDKSANLARLCQIVTRAASSGAELVVCPEASMHGFDPVDAPLAQVAEPLDGPFVTGLAEAARRDEVTVVAGMFEAVPGDATRAYNTVVAVGRDGALLASYRKIHLFDALGQRESDRLEPGDLAPVTFCCAGLTVGLMTCYDLRFPELARVLADAGADLIAVPSAWYAGPLKADQWLTLVRARAIENTCYVAAADQSRPQYIGRSLVVDPAGVPVVSLAETDEEVAVAEVTAERIAEVRRAMPSLQHRRYTVVPRG